MNPIFVGVGMALLALALLGILMGPDADDGYQPIVVVAALLGIATAIGLMLLNGGVS